MKEYFLKKKKILKIMNIKKLNFRYLKKYYKKNY